jgi:hypothetical protein
MQHRVTPTIYPNTSPNDDDDEKDDNNAFFHEMGIVYAFLFVVMLKLTLKLNT